MSPFSMPTDGTQLRIYREESSSPTNFYDEDPYAPVIRRQDHPQAAMMAAATNPNGFYS